MTLAPGDARNMNLSYLPEIFISQVTDFWKNVLKAAERERLVDNIASHLCNAQQFIQVGSFEILELYCHIKSN